jgi:cytochrome P450
VVDLLTPLGEELHAGLRAAAQAGPLATEGSSGTTIVLRHADVEALARDPRLAGVGLSFFDLMGIADGPLRDWYGGLMFTNEGAKHDRLRKLVARAFTPRSAEKLRTEAGERATRTMSAVVADGEGDLTSAFSLVAMRVMCRLLGVPEADVAVFAGWADALSPIFGFMSPEQIAAGNDAIVAMLGYVEELAARRRTDPADDLITGLIAAEDQGDRLSHDELVAMVANLLVGGHDTTTSQIGCSFLTMLRFPDQADRLRADMSLLQSAVEETIRYEPSIAGVPRTVVEPITVAGTDLAPGTVVMLCTGAANREPGIWDEPDRFDVTRFSSAGGHPQTPGRKGAPALLSFGAGAHFCLGAALARMTLQEAVRALVTHGASLRLTEAPEDIPWRSVLGRSPARLPVAAA